MPASRSCKSELSPLLTFSLALVEDGVPVLGVIYDPMLDRMFFASKGNGAFLNGDKICVSTSDNLFNRPFGIEGSGGKIGVDGYALQKSLREKEAPIFRFNSMIFSGAMVAAGEFLGAIFLLDSAHDCAAIKIIVEEAGGKVTDVEGNEQRYDMKINGMVATNGLVHNEVIELIKKK